MLTEIHAGFSQTRSSRPYKKRWKVNITKMVVNMGGGGTFSVFFFVTFFTVVVAVVVVVFW